MRSKSSSAPKLRRHVAPIADGLISMAGKRSVLAPCVSKQPAQRHRLLLGPSDEDADTVQRRACGQPVRSRSSSVARARGQHALGQLLAQSARGTSTLPEIESRSSREPSGSATRPSSVKRSPSSAHAPRSAIGSCRRAGARTRAPRPWRCACRRARARARSASVRASAPRHSMPMTPCATAGRQIAGSRRAVMRDSKPSRIRPAQASTMASNSPASRRRSRVSTLPRSGSMRKSGRAASNCA